VVSASEWDELIALAYESLSAGGHELQAMRDATGIDWCDAGWPGRIPPTPGRRNMASTRASLPRNLRRIYDRVHAGVELDDVLDVLAILHDACLEAAVIGHNRMPEYLEHLVNMPYGNEVLQFIIYLYDWVVGIDRREGIPTFRVVPTEPHDVEACASSLDVVDPNTPVTLAEASWKPPMRTRPANVPTGPPITLWGYVTAA
jgi:hypothetical protein